MKRTTQTVSPMVERTASMEPLIGDYGQENINGAGDQPMVEWLWVLWNQRLFLWRVSACALLIATVIAFLIPKRFQSTTRLMPPDQQSGTGLAMLAAMSGKAGGGSGIGSGINLGGLAGDLLGMKNTGDLFLEILRSRTVEDRLIQRFDLRKIYRDRYWEDARKDLANSTDLSADRKSGVITIMVIDRDPHRAQLLAQGYVEELDRLVAEVSTSSARRERQFIEERLKTAKVDLDQASKQFSEYASQNTTVDITAQAKAMVEGAARLQGALIAAQSELEGLEQIYTPNNVRVRSLRARVDELKRQLRNLGGDTSAGPSGSTGGNLDPKPQEFPSIRQLPLLGVRWADLYRQTKIEETVYELLTQQYELAKIQEAKEIPVIKVLDAAVVPERKSGPHRLLIMVLSTLFAFVAGCVWLMGNAIWRNIDPSDARKVLVREMATTVQARSLYWRNRLRDRRRNGSEPSGS